MRTLHPNRQARRAALCIKARQPSPFRAEPAISRRWLAIHASGSDLARLAEDVADELELAPELIDNILWPGMSQA